MNFYYPEKIQIPNKKNYPIFQFSNELKKFSPQCNWSIIDNPPAMMDCHVAEIYGKTTSNFNLQIERNKEYFKVNWRFQPTLQEWSVLKSIIKSHLKEAAASCNSLKEHLGKQIFRDAPPWFYTKEGIDMAAFFQKTPMAKQYAIYIVESFHKFQQQNDQSELDLFFSIEEQLKDIHFMIKAIVDQVNLLNERCHKLEKKIAPPKIIIKPNLPPVSSHVKLKEQNFPPISVAQAQRLKSKVAAISPERKKRMKVWAQFKKEFSLTRYIHLPSNKFEESMRWLELFTFD